MVEKEKEEKVDEAKKGEGRWRRMAKRIASPQKISSKAK